MSSSLSYISADNLKLSHSISSPEDVYLLQSDLDSIYQWSSKWKLPVNATKLAHMHLGFRFQPGNYNFNSHSISLVHSFKDLGVTVDDKLTFREHIKNISTTAHRLGAITYHAFSTRQTQFLTRVFTAYIRPKLEYAVPVWLPHLTCDIVIIERVLRLFTKRIPQLRDLSYTERLSSMKVSSLTQR